MKASFIRLTTLGLAATGTLLATSCATTGDPSTGGIFWSENKAQGRLAERQSHLESVEKKTDRTKRQSRETQRRIDELR